jgi:hypothetical protein
MDDFDFEVAARRAVREYSLRSDHMPNEQLTLLYQLRETTRISDKLYHNNPTVPSDTKTYLEIK